MKGAYEELDAAIIEAIGCGFNTVSLLIPAIGEKAAKFKTNYMIQHRPHLGPEHIISSRIQALKKREMIKRTARGVCWEKK